MLSQQLLECLLLQTAHTLAALWPVPGELLTRDTPVRGLLIEHGIDPLALPNRRGNGEHQ